MILSPNLRKIDQWKNNHVNFKKLILSLFKRIVMPKLLYNV